MMVRPSRYDVRTIREYGYRLLLLAYPRDFRERYGGEILDTLKNQRIEPRYTSRCGAAVFWFDVLSDICRSALRRRAQQLASLAGMLWRRLRQRRRSHRQGRGNGNVMDNLIRDVSYALRVFRRRPIFTSVAVLTLALGIGANVAVFSLVYALLYRPLPAADAERFVSLLTVRSDSPVPIGMSWPDFQDYLGMTEVFSDAVAYEKEHAQLSSDSGLPERIVVQLVTKNYFSLLGAEAVFGRVFTTDDTDSGVVLISHGYWQRRFGGDPSVLGESVHLNGQAFTVSGVTPEHISGYTGLLAVDVYVPLDTYDRLFPSMRGFREDRGNLDFHIIAKLQPGVSLSEARAAVRVQAKHLQEEYPETNRGLICVVYPEPRTRLEPAAPTYLPPVMAVFMTLVGLVLLIACANVTNLFLAHTVGREKEISIRAALGSGRGRIFRQLLTESMMLSALGAACGMVLAHWATSALSSIELVSGTRIAFDVGLEYPVFKYAILIAVVTGVLTGLVPSLHACRLDLNGTLKEGSRSSGARRRNTFSRILVVSQVAVSLVLTISAVLFLRSMMSFQKMDLGFRTEDRLILSVDATLLHYDDEQGRVFFRDLLDRVRALPGVNAAATADSAPMGGHFTGTRVFAEGKATVLGEGNMLVHCSRISLDYFHTLGIPIVAGRAFTEHDRPSSRGVVIVNEVLAERLWPGQNPLGKRLSIQGESGPFLDVVGVAKLSKYNMPGEAPTPFLYLPHAQNYRGLQVLTIHTDGNPVALASVVREEILALDPDMPVFDVRTLEAHICEGGVSLLFRLAVGLVGSFGLVGICLACLGLYGVMAFSVNQHVHEMGVRMALGATSGKILAMVIRRGLMLTLAGVGLGLTGAVALTPVFANLLVGVSPTDPITFVGVALLMVLIALLSAYIPARRATRIDPLRALRCE